MTGEDHPRLDIVVDASVVLAAYFPDESTLQAQRLMEDYALGRVNLWAPRLLVLELINACLVARNRNRIDDRLLDDLAAQLAALDIQWVTVEENVRQVFSLSKEHGLTAYDAAYIAAAQMKECKLITGDRRLYNTVKGDLSFVVLLDDYESDIALVPDSGRIAME